MAAVLTFAIAGPLFAIGFLEFLFIGEVLREVKFRGRGCSVCIASSSMMTEAVSGQSVDDARHMCEDMQHWFQQGEGEGLAAPPADLQALSAVREYPARRRCVLLSWEALADALDAV